MWRKSTVIFIHTLINYRVFILGYLQCKLYMHVQSTNIERFFSRSHLNNFPFDFCCCCSIRLPPYRTRRIKISVCLFLPFIFTKLSCGIQHILVYLTHTNFVRKKKWICQTDMHATWCQNLSMATNRSIAMILTKANYRTKSYFYHNIIKQHCGGFRNPVVITVLINAFHDTKKMKLFFVCITIRIARIMSCISDRWVYITIPLNQILLDWIEYHMQRHRDCLAV